MSMRVLWGLTGKGCTMENHIVVFGWDYFIKSIVEQLVKARQRVMIITNRPEHGDILNDFSGSGKPQLLISSYHDYQKLIAADLEKSRIVLVNLQDDTRNLVFILKLKRRYPNIRIVVPINNIDLSDTFVRAGITYSLSRSEICAKLFASHLFEKHVAEYLDDVLSSGGESEDEHDIQQYRMLSDNPVVGMSYQAVFVKLKKEFNAVLIGISKISETGNRMLYKNPYGDITVEVNDYLIVIVNGTTAGRISDYFGVAEGG